MTIVVEDDSGSGAPSAPAIASYTALQASIANWLNRTDLGAIIPDFIAIAEARMQTDLRLREGVTVSSLVTEADVATVTLPEDWLEFVSLSIGGVPLEHLSGDRLRKQATEGGSTSYYAIEGPNLLLNPTPGAVETIDVQYYAKLPGLQANETNWLLTKYPQIYLYASLVSGFQYLMNDARADYFGNLYAQAVAIAKAADVRATSSGSPLRIRPR